MAPHKGLHFLVKGLGQNHASPPAANDHPHYAKDNTGMQHSFGHSFEYILGLSLYRYTGICSQNNTSSVSQLQNG
jgi:hypothetical protein